MQEYRRPGEACAVRGMVNGRVWLVQTVIVVADSEEETILLQMPGAQCMFPEGLVRRKRGDFCLGTRWEEASRGEWNLVAGQWTTNRFLMFLQPGRFYSICYVWNDARNEFLGYYVNFELPFRRSHCGFDTYDLELDIRVSPELVCSWKDVEDYEDGVRTGAIRPEWVAGIEAAKPKVLAGIEQRSYPFDAAWRTWRPDPGWLPPQLPQGWARVEPPSAQD